jgi:hypothetical protein
MQEFLSGTGAVSLPNPRDGAMPGFVKPVLVAISQARVHPPLTHAGTSGLFDDRSGE